MIASRDVSNRVRAGALAVGLTVTLWAGPLAAQRVWSVELDNDFFNAPPLDQPTDADYSQGLRIRHRLPATSPLARWLLGPAPACHATATMAAPPCHTWSVEVDQEVYTPWVDRPRPEPGDRPYAGWLGVAVRSVLLISRTSHALVLKAGVTGPPSLAGPVQRLFHQLIRNPMPLGWVSQLAAMGSIEAAYEGTTELLDAGREGGIRLGLAPAWGVALGTIRTEARAGVRTALELGARGAARWRETGGPPRGLSTYLVAGISGRAVARDLFLDTHLPDIPPVGHLPFVAEAELGLGLRIHGVGLEYRMLRSTRQYATQPHPHTYATIAIMR